MKLSRRSSFALAAALAVGCGARSPLRDGDRGSGGAGGAPPPPCDLELTIAPRLVFPDSAANSESIFPSHFTDTAAQDQQCFLSLRKVEGAATFTIDQRCMRGFGATFDPGTPVTMGTPMPDDSIIPPADLLVARGEGAGFAMYYAGAGQRVFGSSVDAGQTSLPTSMVSTPMRVFALGPPDGVSRFILESAIGSPVLRGARIDATGLVHDEQDLMCTSNDSLAIRAAHVGSSDIVVARNDGGAAPECKAIDGTSAFAIRSTHQGAKTIVEPLPGPLSSLAITPFGANEAFVIASVAVAGGGEYHAFRIDELGTIEQQFNLGPGELAFGVSAAEIGGALLLVEDAPRGAGAMDDTGFVAKLVDSETGRTTASVEIPMATNTVDSPAPPAIVTSPDGTEVLLGFFVQPLGTGGRDYVARMDCKK